MSRQSSRRRDDRTQNSHRYSRGREQREPSEAERLYRSALDTAKRIDAAVQSTTCCEDLFKSELTVQRHRLKQLCESLLFLHHPGLGRSAEDLVWKKAFYVTISRCKQNKQAMASGSPLECAYRTHLAAASGFYQQLLLRLQRKYHLTQLTGLLDWMQLEPSASPANGREVDEAVSKWALQACHRCLVCLGDIARYQQDFEDTGPLACRFYHQAICLDPSFGIPHNQLATIALGQSDDCATAFHYLMGLSCAMPFAGTETNLARLFQKNTKTHEELIARKAKGVAESESKEFTQKQFVCHFLQVQQLMRPPCKCSSHDLSKRWRHVIDDVTELLRLSGDDWVDNEEDVGDGLSFALAREKKEGRRRLTMMMLQAMAMAVLATHRLRSDGSSHTPAVTMFTLTLLQQLVQFSVEIIRPHIPPKESEGSMSLPHPNGAWRNHRKEKMANVHLDFSDALKNKLTLDEAVSAAVETALTNRSSSAIEASALHCSQSPADINGLPAHKRHRRAPRSRRRRQVASSDESEDEPVQQNENGFGDELSSDEKNTSDEEFFSSDDSDESESGSNGEEVSSASRVVGLFRSSSVDNSPTVAVKPPMSCRWLDLLCVLDQLGLWMAVRVACDWLALHPAVVATCAKSASGLWSSLAELLNLLPHGKDLAAAAEEVCVFDHGSLFSSRSPLPEDIMLLGFSPLAGIQEHLSFDWSRMESRLSSYQEVLLRVHRLHEFGAAMANNKALPSFTWDSLAKRYVGPAQQVAAQKLVDEKLAKERSVEEAAKREKFMKAMAQRKLQVDVEQLERNLEKVPASSRPLSPYLVLDPDALILHLDLIKKLAASQMFIIIIPLQVIATLDHLKKGRASQPVREVIKFLEYHFRRGNRWLRGQREKEVAGTTLRQRKDDPAEWRFLQIVDCCIFLANHAAGKASMRPSSHAMVTLLTGLPPYSKDSSSGVVSSERALALAKENGVDVTVVSRFFSKWNAQNKKVLPPKSSRRPPRQR